MTTAGKFHLTPKGPGPCHATKRICRYGGKSGEEQHFTSQEAAQAAFERRVLKEEPEASAFGTVSKRAVGGQAGSIDATQREASMIAYKMGDLLNEKNSAKERLARAERMGDQEAVTEYKGLIQELGSKHDELEPKFDAAQKKVEAAKAVFKERTTHYPAKAYGYHLALAETPASYDMESRSTYMNLHAQDKPDSVAGRSLAPSIHSETSFGEPKEEGRFTVQTTSYGAFTPTNTRRVAAWLRHGAETAEVLDRAYRKPSEGKDKPLFDERVLEKLPQEEPKSAPAGKVEVSLRRQGEVTTTEDGLRNYREVAQVGDDIYEFSATASARAEGGQYLRAVRLRNSALEKMSKREWQEKQEVERFHASITERGSFDARPSFEVQTTSYGSLDPATVRHIANELDRGADRADALNAFTDAFERRSRKALQ